MENQDPLLDDQNLNQYPGEQDELSTPLKVLSFCVPIGGAIIYFTTDRARYPNKAKQACNWALIGVGVGIVLNILLAVVGAGISN
jgi:hypothetical protein